MWLLPSRGRPALAARWFVVGRPRFAGCLMIDKDEAAGYGPAFAALPENWVVSVRPRATLAAKLNAALTLFPEAPWYGITNDDVTCDTPGWDVALVAEWRAGARIVYGNDGGPERISTALFDAGLVHTLGWLAPPGLRHFYIDDAHELIAQHVPVVYRRDVLVTHRHFTAGLAPHDQTYAERGNPDDDRAAFETWKRDGWPAALDRLQQMGIGR